MAYALAAFARPRLTLANPGIMTTLYPQFWALYNALPETQTAKAAHNEAGGEGAEAKEDEERHDEPKRKRVRLSGIYAGAGGAREETGG
jgi:hypothetical protein